MVLSESVTQYIAKQDAMLNQRAGFPQDALQRHIVHLLTHGQVEFGWRESCGKMDSTMHVYRAWNKVLSKLKKMGLAITEERVKHKNAYATNSGGFWNSIIYRTAKVTDGKAGEA